MEMCASRVLHSFSQLLTLNCNLMSCSIAIMLIVEFKARPYHLKVDVNVLYEKILTKSIVQTSLMPNKMLTKQDLHDNTPVREAS